MGASFGSGVKGIDRAGELDMFEQLTAPWPGIGIAGGLEGLEAEQQAPATAPASVRARRHSKASVEIALARFLTDMLVFIGAAWAAYWVRFEWDTVFSSFPAEAIPATGDTIFPVLCSFPLFVLLLSSSGMYRTRVLTRTLDTLPRIVTAVNGLVIAMFVMLYLFNAEISMRGYMIVFWFTLCVFVFLGRLGLQTAMSVGGVPDVVRRNTLIVGAGKTGAAMARKLRNHPEFGLDPVGFVDDDPLFETFDGEDLEGLEVLGGLGDFWLVARERDVEKVIIAFSRDSHEKLLQLVSECNRAGLDCSVMPRLFEVISDRSPVIDVGGMALVPVEHRSMGLIKSALKRAEDFILAVAGLLVFWPLLLITAIAIKVESRGPVFYKQKRVGADGRTFDFIKFRSMVDGADRMRDSLENENGEEDLLWKVHDDPRITKVGKWIRKFSIDEAPQIFNVLKGDMSVVGPRPGLPDEVDRYTDWHRLRLHVKPGITGLWQVNGRSGVPFDEMVKYDLYYIRRWSLWLDVKTIVRTVSAVLLQRGAY